MKDFTYRCLSLKVETCAAAVSGTQWPFSAGVFSRYGLTGVPRKAETNNKFIIIYNNELKETYYAISFGSFLYFGFVSYSNIQKTLSFCHTVYLNIPVFTFSLKRSCLFKPRLPKLSLLWLVRANSVLYSCQQWCRFSRYFIGQDVNLRLFYCLAYGVCPFVTS